MMYVFCAFIFASIFQQNQAVITIDFDEDIRECGNGLPTPDVDVSQFNVLPQNDGSILLNGTITIIKSYGDPITWRMYSKRLEQGKWNPGLISRDIPNVCPVFKMPTEPWYQYTKYLDDLHCPIHARRVERFDNLNIGNMGDFLVLPPQFLGEWRIYHEIATLRNGFPVRECFMLPTTIAEA